MTEAKQPEASSTHIIRYALEMGLLWIDGDGRDKVREALDALDTLEAQLEAIGAGGVSALMGAAKAGSEPVATVFTMEALTPGGGVKHHATIHKPLPAGTKLYAAPQPALSAGWVMVPIEPTEAMVSAGYDAFGVHDCYAAMIAAAPTLPVEPSKDGESNADQA